MQKFQLLSKYDLALREGYQILVYDDKFNSLFLPFLVFNKKKNQYIQFDNWNIEDDVINYPVDQVVS